ncbi:MAG: hypothetical protein ACI9VR_003912, partial [Cognaticolwellia sp.]
AHQHSKVRERHNRRDRLGAQQLRLKGLNIQIRHSCGATSQDQNKGKHGRGIL